jgi:hypothetical protein
MKMKMKMLAVMLMMSSVPAIAGFSDFEATDWRVDNDSLATLDKTTGLEWLDLTQTNRYSYNDLQTELDGGLFDGWRMPTKSEVTSMTVNYLDNTLNIAQYNDTGKVHRSVEYTNSNANNFRSNFGTTNPASGLLRTIGLFQTERDLGTGQEFFISGIISIPSQRRQNVYINYYATPILSKLTMIMPGTLFPMVGRH